MDLLASKIKEIERFRDSFFANNPGSSKADKTRAVREKVLPLLQDIPLELNGSSSAEYDLQCGRILNICDEYDPNCERHLTKAVKMDPTSDDAWAQLGDCFYKKGDFQASIDCFRTAILHNSTALSLSSLAILLRQCSRSESDPTKREKMQKEAIEFSKKAVELEPKSAIALQSLGNSYFTMFFSRGQIDKELLKSARETYEKALQFESKKFNSDLHLNYATVLNFDQEYRKCLEVLRVVRSKDPGFQQASDLLQSVSQFLQQISESIAKRGRLKTKRITQLKSALCANDLGIYRNKLRSHDGKIKELRLTSFNDLKQGINPGVVVVGKVAAMIFNCETVPYTFIGFDDRDYFIAVSVYNFSPNFGVTIGDSFAIPEPTVIDVQIDEMDQKNGGSAINFRLIRLMNPLKMLRNGKLLRANCIAFCSTTTTCIS